MSIIEEADISIPAEGILHEKHVRKEIPYFEPFGDIKKTYSKQQNDKKPTFTFNFDVLSLCFILITRYEEYLDHAKDEFGRYICIMRLDQVFEFGNGKVFFQRNV